MSNVEGREASPLDAVIDENNQLISIFVSSIKMAKRKIQ